MTLTDDSDLRREMVDLIPRLRRFALGLSRSQADADDLVQSALEKALTRLNQFERGTRLDSWLFRIVQTTWIDDRRRAWRRETPMDSDSIQIAAGPALQSTAEFSLKDIMRALNTLPDDQRVLVLLVLVEGYSYQEAADMSDVPIGTVMSRLSRARKMMATRLEGSAS